MKNFLKDVSGNVALSVAIMAVPLFATAGVAVDYSIIYQSETILQNAADAAALSSAKELGLSNSQTDIVKDIAKTYVLSYVSQHVSLESGKNSLDTKTTISDDRQSITVDLAYYWKPFLLQYIGSNVLPIKVSATANLAGSGKICMIGLDTKEKDTIHLTKKASLEAAGCGIYANSSNKDAVKVEDNASIVSGVTCSAGGIKGAKKASFTPEPITDCPAITDPLENRQTPTVGGCDYTKFEVKSGIHTLNPGTYCKGLKVKKTAKVFLNPGIYIINGDKLEVTDDAVFEGENVGFFLSGNKAKLVFKKRTTINLTAPKDGLLAGLLMFEDPSASKIEKHEITSDNARLLLGTIYLPNGTLKIDSEGPIADKAAYTAIIARRIELKEGPTLYLNSDYEATDVPVPEGLKGSDNVILSK